MIHDKSPHPSYTVVQVYQQYMQCFAIRGRVVDGFLFIAKESIKTKQLDMAKNFIRQAMDVEPGNEEALQLKRLIEQGDAPSSWSSSSASSSSASSADSIEKAKELFTIGIAHFGNKNYLDAAAVFEKACILGAGNAMFNVACTNAAYCRGNISDWGENGTQFQKDMETIATITHEEVDTYRSVDRNGIVKWNRATSVHPHMNLGYPVDPMLQRYCSESHAFMDEASARFDGETGVLSPLPGYLPYDRDARREEFVEDATSRPDFKIRVGFVSSGFNSKAVLYLSHDMFRFIDKDTFEVHIFSVGAADNPMFIKNAMRGVDWRERVKANADYFHDVEYLKDDHIQLANMIHDLNIHILIEWDGYARQGLRAQGLFGLRPAPLQVLHQEFLGTYGGDYVDYIVTDPVTSPEDAADLYVEKFIYLPNHFFSKGHAVQDEVVDPTYEFQPKQTPYVLGTGSPQENRCLSPANVGPEKVSFVYCNFNKFLKNNPETMISWIETLRNVPDSILCLLENPPSGVQNLRKFVIDVASSSGINDGRDLNERIHFLGWENNPFDHQMRNQDFCNVIVDSHPYNGHTTAQDGTFLIQHSSMLSLIGETNLLLFFFSRFE